MQSGVSQRCRPRHPTHCSTSARAVRTPAWATPCTSLPHARAGYPLRLRTQDHVDALSVFGGTDGAFGFEVILRGVTSGFASEDRAQDVQAFAEMHPELQIPERIVRTVAGRIRTSAIWVENYSQEYCTMLRKPWLAGVDDLVGLGSQS